MSYGQGIDEVTTSVRRQKYADLIELMEQMETLCRGLSNLSVVITGGRKYRDMQGVYRPLNLLHEVVSLAGVRDLTISIGDCPTGVDDIANHWAIANGRSTWVNLEANRYRANWAKYGLAAGPMRNRQMLEQAAPDFVMAWPGGKGTANCCVQAKLMGIPVLQVRKDDALIKERTPPDAEL